MSTGAQVSGLRFDRGSIRTLDCHGDNWHVTWLADGTHLVALCDGIGFPGLAEERYFNSRLLRMSGPPDAIELADVPGYPDLSMALRGADIATDPNPRYYGFGTISIRGTVYQYLSTWNMPMGVAGLTTGDLKFVGAKLIASPDAGATWHNQDGSSPVHWEDWDERSRDTMVFFDEPDGAFGLISVLQMGRDYELNRDGYVYLYAPDGNSADSMRRLMLARVPVDAVLDRGAYEFYAGADDGSPRWSADSGDRRPVHEFPDGWVNTTVHAYAWHPFVVYNPGLGLYMMSSWATRPGPDGEWFAGSSYLSVHVAETPWGPWRLVHEDTEWSPQGDPAERCYQAVIPPGWISDDGRSFWMIWTDFQNPGHERATEVVRELSSSPALDAAEYRRRFISLNPFYRINLQRVTIDLEPDGS